MVAILADLIVNLIGDDTQLIAATKRSAAALEKNATVADSVKASFMKLGAGSALALTGIATYSIHAASTFQVQMELIHTQAGETQANVDSLSKSVLALAPTVGIGPEKLAEGLYHVASAAAGTGMSAATMMDILTASAKEASMGMADMQTTSSALVSIMVTQMRDVRDAADATSYLNEIVGMGNMRMQDLVNALGTGVLPAFKSAGLGIRDFGAAEAYLTDMGEPASQAATRLRTALVMMTHDTPAANKALAQIGLTTTDLAKTFQQPDGLLKALNLLKSHLAGLPQYKQNQLLEAAFGGARVGSTIEALVQNTTRLGQKYQMLGTEASRTAKQQEGWAATQKTFKQQANELGASLQTMAIQLGEKLLPYLSKFVTFLVGHQAAMKAFFAIVVIGLTLITAAWLAMSLSMMANPVFWIVAAIVAAVALLAIGIYELVKHWKTVWGFIKRIAEDVWHWLVDAWNATWNAIKAAVLWINNTIIKPIVNFFNTYLVKPITAYLRAMADVWKFIWGFMSVIIHDFFRIVEALWKNVYAPIYDWVKNITLAFVRWYYDTFIKPIIDTVKWVMTQIDKAWHGWVEIFDKTKAYMTDFYLWMYGKFAKPVEDVIHNLGAAWDKIWNGMKDTVQFVWKIIYPTFQAITRAIKDVIGFVKEMIHDLSSDPTGLGKAVAHMFNFDKGGTVPGAPGQPMLVLAHGGEVILPNTVTGSIRSGQPINVSGMSSGAIAASMGGGGYGSINEFRFFLGPKEMRDFSVQELQRRKVRNSHTGVT